MHYILVATQNYFPFYWVLVRHQIGNIIQNEFRNLLFYGCPLHLTYYIIYMSVHIFVSPYTHHSKTETLQSLIKKYGFEILYCKGRGNVKLLECEPVGFVRGKNVTLRCKRAIRDLFRKVIHGAIKQRFFR